MSVQKLFSVVDVKVLGPSGNATEPNGTKFGMVMKQK